MEDQGQVKVLGQVDYSQVNVINQRQTPTTPEPETDTPPQDTGVTPQGTDTPPDTGQDTTTQITPQVEDNIDTPTSSPEPPQDTPTVATPQSQTPVVETTKPIDPVLVAMQKVYEEDGSFDRGIRLLQTDWDKLSDEEVLRQAEKAKLPDMESDLFDVYFDRKVMSKFQPEDEDDDLEVRLAKVNMTQEANKFREKMKQEKQDLLDSVGVANPQGSTASGADAEPVSQWENIVLESESTRSVLQDRKIVLKVGDSQVNVDVGDVESLINQTKDQQQFFQQFDNGKGQVDFDKWYKVVAFANDPEAFMSALILHGKSQANASIANELTNPSDSSSPSTTQGTQAVDPIQALLAAKKKNGFSRI